MKKYHIFIVLIFISFVCMAQLPIGTIRKPIMTDNNGNVVSTNLVFSNQVVMVAAPTISNHIARLMDVTNQASVTASITNITGDSSILVSGSGHTRALSYSNASGFATTSYVDTSLTNGHLTFSTIGYKIGGVSGFSGSVTNMGNPTGTATNIQVFGSGILTNVIRIP